MLVADLITRHPRLFHMAEAGTWPQIQRHGLLSTTALLDLFGIVDGTRFAIESERRGQIVEIEHPVHGSASIRDNKPLREQFLAGCLQDMSMREWYELLNHKVFFWVRPERLDKLLNARAYRARAHDVLTLDTAALLERHGDTAALASINTGATLYPSAPMRGPDTFVPIAAFDFAEARRRRGAAEAIVELTVDYAVPDLEGLVVQVERRKQGEPNRVLWEASPRSC